LALGADAVGMGRMQGLAAAAAGQAGIVRMLEIVEDEVKRCMALLGVTSISELDESFVTQIAPLDRPGLESAFPLLSEGY
jgi:glycolate oxidase